VFARYVQNGCYIHGTNRCAMMRTATLLSTITLAASLFAATGGPDAYGYTWKDSNEPDGPVFNWIDITAFGTQVTGLADDNVVGPFLMQTNMPFYWYAPKKVWIGSNGYIAFNNVNVASPFPVIPEPGAPNDYVACLMSDLNFTGTGNTGTCWYFDDPTITIVSWLDLPFWTSVAPGYTGENSFQVILNKLDSTITVQYMEQTGFSFNGDLLTGIESLTGDIGLQHSADTYPQTGYAVRYYAPAVPLIDIIDASVEWVSDESSKGSSLKRFGPQLPLTINVRNTGNVGLGGLTTQGTVYNTAGTPIVLDTWPVDTLPPGIDTTITFPATFNPTQQGTYRFEGAISGIPGEVVITNNTRNQELVVYDTTLATQVIGWSGPLDDFVGIGWAGGNAGVGVQIVPPVYPAYVTGVRIRISSNTTPVGYVLRIWDDDGPDGTHGTLIDSIMVAPSSGGPGDHIHPVTTPFTITEGSVYVEWYMLGDFVNIAQDIQPPFSLRTYEVLSNVWAEYRDRETADFHLGLQTSEVPIYDLDCTGFFGLIDGLDVTGPTTVRAWVKNLGNVTMVNFPMKYAWNGGTPVSQMYTTPALLPGDSALFTFSTPFTPTSNETGTLCAWADLATDADETNDTSCVSIDAFVGILDPVAAQLAVSPNPAHTQVTITGLPSGRVEIGLFDLSGALVLRTVSNARATAVVDVTDVAPGTYLLQAVSSARSYTAKLVVQR